ncbi:hypothetical protein RCL_jg21524.t1 [Rhizophagus clarus]|uniref:Uncharacterized protein n=1 Tax=Rhizophagus clarus TaxID=94130 RepID=A0A8H3KZ01_9GLOM|nr:hypothetical protein RCL_jg21524.t1 [Rhizophagus clarus]
MTIGVVVLETRSFLLYPQVYIQRSWRTFNSLPLPKTAIIGIQEKKDREEKEEDERIVISINTAREEVPSRDETDSKICRDIHYQRYSTCIGQPKVLNDALFKLVRKGDD